VVIGHPGAYVTDCTSQVLNTLLNGSQINLYTRPHSGIKVKLP